MVLIFSFLFIIVEKVKTRFVLQRVALVKEHRLIVAVYSFFYGAKVAGLFNKIREVFLEV